MSIMMEYLRQLQKNNQRDWFQSHKELRKEAEAEFEELLQELMERIACFDSSINGFAPKELTFKQVRDTRFSKDKTPYLPAFRAHISAKGKLPIPVGYYIHLMPDHPSFLGGGLFADMFKDATAMMRDAIAAKPEEFSAIIEAPSFKDHFTITGTKLKRVPKGYDPDHSMASYLCHKSWCLEYPLMDNEVEDREKFLTLACTLFHAMKPCHDFMNTALQDFQFPQR